MARPSRTGTSWLSNGYPCPCSAEDCIACGLSTTPVLFLPFPLFFFLFFFLPFPLPLLCFPALA